MTVASGSKWPATGESAAGHALRSCCEPRHAPDHTRTIGAWFTRSRGDGGRATHEARRLPAGGSTPGIAREAVQGCMTRPLATLGPYGGGRI